MGVKIFRDDNWDRLTCGVISGKDLLGLDRVKDRRLIEWLILHMTGRKREAAMERFGITEEPCGVVNVDDPDDDLYPVYFVLLEQVRRENDREVLKEAAFRRRDIPGRFAFCRLTGFCRPPDECDAYSYRTYECGLKSGTTRKDIEDFCREMTEKNGPFAKEAEQWLTRLADIDDETLERWADAL